MKNLIAKKLKELRETRNYSLQQVAEQVGVSKQSIHKFETSIVSPSIDTLLKLSDFFNVPFSFFYDTTESMNIQFENIKFREKHKIVNEKFENEIKVEVSKYLSKFFKMQSIFNETVEFKNPLTGFDSISDMKDIEKAAKIVREKWKIGNAPITDVVETLEEKGIYIVEVFRVEDFTGLSGTVNDEIPVIVLNENCLTVERKRFTALHELGHIVLEFDENISEQKIERFCDNFAGAVLLVDDIIHDELGKNRTIISLAELRRIKEKYGISIQAIIMRVSTSGFIDKKTSNQWWELYKGWNTNESIKSDFGRFRSGEKSNKLKRLLVRAVTENKMSVSKAAEIYEKKVDVFKREIDKLNFSIN